jgi:hypothetical protein
MPKLCVEKMVNLTGQKVFQGFTDCLLFQKILSFNPWPLAAAAAIQFQSLF